jgi:hypothetical protein
MAAREAGSSSLENVIRLGSSFPLRVWDFRLAWLSLQPLRRRQHVGPKRRLSFDRLHGVTT